MSSLGSPNPFFIAGKKAYEVERSLRFNDGDSPNLARTFGSSTNVRLRTISVWVKRSKINDSYGQGFFQYGVSGAGDAMMFLGAGTGIGINDQFRIGNRNATSGSGDWELRTNRLFRDVSAWYHIVVQYDTTQSTASDRVKLYVNGVQETSFAAATYPSQNYDSTAFLAGTGGAHNIGYSIATGSANYFGGYLAEFNFLDGYAYDASYFGETDPVTGQWNPKKYVGSYGTNGFYLNFSDNSGTTATTLGKDYSGNGNNFTPNNFAVSDAVKDSPTNNFCTHNPLDDDYANVSNFSEGNLQIVRTGNNHGSTRGTIGMSSGKWYFEYCYTSTTNSGAAPWVGVCNSTADITGFRSSGMWNYGASSGQYLVRDGTSYDFGSAISAGTVLGVAIDMDNKKIWIADSNTWFGSSNNDTNGNPSTGANATDTFTDTDIPDGNLYPQMGSYSYNAIKANFGQDSSFSGTKTAQGNTDANGIGDFFYAPPTGFKALCSANLPDPTIKLPNQHFNSLLYTATGNAMTATDTSEVNFTPDFLWQKRRDSTGGSHSHYLFDSVRGGRYGLQTNTNGAEFDSTDNSNIVFVDGGFEMAASNGGQGNGSGGTYVAWNWNGGDTDGKTYTVKVVSDSGNKYRFDDFGTSAVTLDLAEGGTYIFDQSDSSNATHPLRFYTAADKSGGEYTTGVTTAGTPGSSGAYTQIVVAASAPTLYYQCSSHAGMGGQVNTNSTLGSSNFDGAIQSTVKVNATAGFSITNFYPTAASTAVTTGHGLGVTPDVVIVKSRGSSANWDVLHMSLGSSYKLYLNGTNAQISSGAWGSTNPTSSVFTYNPGSQNNNNQIAYCFSEVAGYSKFGSWTAVGSTDGRFVFTGFRPAWVMAKQTTGGGGNWFMVDDKRSPFNVVNDLLDANINNAERNADIFDFLSNGFKIRLGLGTGETFIYLAFAESPFKNARAR